MSRPDVQQPSRMQQLSEANEQVFTNVLASLRASGDPPEMRVGVAPGCLWCALHAARDRERAARWLHTDAARGRDAIGVASCPLHTWRVYALVETAATTGNTQMLDAISALYLRALSVLRAQIHQEIAHVDGSGPMRWLWGAHAPGLLHLRPSCALCDERAHVMAEERAAVAAWLAQRLELEPGWLRRAAFAGACHAHAPASAAPRAAPESHASSRSRLQSPRDDRAAMSWWLGPGASAQGAALLWRLLGEARGGSEGEHDMRPLPDGLCPLCVARWEHESAALQALAEDEWSETFDRRALCPRHHAFMLAPEARTVRRVGAEVTLERLAEALQQTPRGALRDDAADDACPVCVTLHGWELARIEGLHRACGGALLYEWVTERLIRRLTNAKYQFCLPHLRALLSAGERERVWETLGASVERGLETLHQRTEALTQDGGALTSSATPTRLMLSAALGGLPV